MQYRAWWLTLVVAAIVAPPVGRAQTVPDTTEPWTYYPLGVGDVWHYEVEYEHFPYCFRCNWQASYEVTAIETIAGRQYAVVLERTYNVPFMPNPPPPSWTERVRFDTTAATLFRYVGSTNDFPHEDAQGCRLDEPFPLSPDTTRAALCPGGIVALIGGGYEQPLPFGGSAAIKTIRRDFGDDITNTTAFAAEIGVLARADTFKFQTAFTARLEFARVAGVEYGTPIVATEPVPAAGGALSVSPNPARGRATIAFTTSSPGPARVTLHDLLGREVLVVYDGWVLAGGRRVSMDVVSFPAGLYVIRTVGAPGIRTEMVVIR